MGINYAKTVQERDAEGLVALNIVKESLKKGWNPFDMPIAEYLAKDQEETPNIDQILIDLTTMPFSKALKFAMEKKKGAIKDSSEGIYSSPIGFALKAAKTIGMDKMPIGLVKKFHIKLLLEQMAKDRQAKYDKEGKGRKFTPNSYNRFKSVLSAHFFELEQWEACPYPSTNNEMKTKS